MLVGAVVVALTTASSAAAATGPRPVDVVRIIDTSRWEPPSPDPQGLAWAPRLHRLVVVDSEVDETSVWAGANVFFARRTGGLSAGAVTSFTDEPNDIVLDRRTGHYFVVNDHPRRLYDIAKGADHRYFTRDDVVIETNLGRGAFTGNRIVDAEGLAMGAGSLWVASDRDKEIFRIKPGPDGRWSGTYAADNRVTHWDTRSLDLLHPEGIEFDRHSRHLFIVSNDPGSNIVEVTKRGRFVRAYDGSSIDSRSPSGLRFAPSRRGRGRSLYMTDRGVDNDQEPAENDGRIFELHLVRPR